MQKLLFDRIPPSDSQGFDDYTTVMRSWSSKTRDTVVQLLRKRDANGKHWYMVIEKARLQASNEWFIAEALEFRHANNRASRYFDRKVSDLGG